jgi:hypothetical protein
MLRALSDAPATGNPSFVIPAKAGIQRLFAKKSLDYGLHWNGEERLSGDCKTKNPPAPP